MGGNAGAAGSNGFVPAAVGPEADGTGEAVSGAWVFRVAVHASGVWKVRAADELSKFWVFRAAAQASGTLPGPVPQGSVPGGMLRDWVGTV